MGGFHVILETAARDILKILERSKVDDDVISDVRVRLARLVERSDVELDVRRAAVRVPSFDIASGVVEDLMKSLLTEEIPRVQIEQLERQWGALADELNDERRMRWEAEARERFLNEKLKRAEEAHNLMMNSLFRELLYLRRAVHDANEDQSNTSRSHTNFSKFKSFSGVTTNAFSPEHSTSVHSGFLGDSSRSMLMGSQSECFGMPRAHLPGTARPLHAEGAQSAVWNREDYRHNSGALFDYQKYVALVNDDIAEFPSRLEALRKELQQRVQESNSEKTQMTVKHNAAIRLKDLLLAQKEDEIASLKRAKQDFADAMQYAIGQTRKEFSTELSEIRSACIAANTQVFSWISRLHNLIETLGCRQSVLLHFVGSCIGRFHRELLIASRGDRPTPLNRAVFEQFLSSKEDESQVSAEAKSFWRSNEQLRSFVESWYSMSEQLLEMHGTLLKAKSSAKEGTKDDATEVGTGPRTVVGSFNAMSIKQFVPDKSPITSMHSMKSSMVHAAARPSVHESACLEVGVPTSDGALEDLGAPEVSSVEDEDESVAADLPEEAEGRQVEVSHVISAVSSPPKSNEHSHFFAEGTIPSMIVKGGPSSSSSSRTHQKLVPMSITQLNEVVHSDQRSFKPPEVRGIGIASAVLQPDFAKTSKATDSHKPRLHPHAPKSLSHGVPQRTIAEMFSQDNDNAEFFIIRSMKSADTDVHVPTLPTSPPDVIKQSRELLIRSRRFV